MTSRPCFKPPCDSHRYCDERGHCSRMADGETLAEALAELARTNPKEAIRRRSANGKC